MYAAHLEKGCMLLGMGPDWKTTAVRVAGQGLAKAGTGQVPLGRR